MIGMVNALTAPKVRAIPRTLKYAAHPAIKKAEAPMTMEKGLIKSFSQN